MDCRYIHTVQVAGIEVTHLTSKQFQQSRKLDIYPNYKIVLQSTARHYCTLREFDWLQRRQKRKCQEMRVNKENCKEGIDIQYNQ